MRHTRTYRTNRKVEKTNALLKGAVFFLALLLLGLGLVFRTSIFTIEHIRISGNAALRAKVFQETKENMRYIFSSQKNVIKNIKHKFPEIREFSISRNIVKKQLDITYSLREPYFIWCGQQKECFQIDKEGVIFAKSNGSEEGIRVSDSYLRNMATAKKLPENIYIPVQNIIQELEARQILVEQIVLNAPYSLLFRQANVPELRFSLQEDIHEQLFALFTFLGESIPSRQLSYIDLRIPGKVYYK